MSNAVTMTIIFKWMAASLAPAGELNVAAHVHEPPLLPELAGISVRARIVKTACSAFDGKGRLVYSYVMAPI